MTGSPANASSAIPTLQKANGMAAAHGNLRLKKTFKKYQKLLLTNKYSIIYSWCNKKTYHTQTDQADGSRAPSGQRWSEIISAHERDSETFVNVFFCTKNTSYQ